MAAGDVCLLNRRVPDCTEIFDFITQLDRTRLDTAVPELKEDREIYLVSPGSWQELPGGLIKNL